MGIPSSLPLEAFEDNIGQPRALSEVALALTDPRKHRVLVQLRAPGGDAERVSAFDPLKCSFDEILASIEMIFRNGDET